MRTKKTPKRSKSSKTKGKSTKQQPPPPKKRGRPSNAELAARARIKREEGDVVREQLLAAMQPGAVVATTGQDQLVTPKYPVFFIGEQVSYGWWEIMHEGHVIEDPDPVNSALVRVRWDDGRMQWHAKENLRSMQKARQRKVVRVIYGNEQRSARDLEGTSSIE